MTLKKNVFKIEMWFWITSKIAVVFLIINKIGKIMENIVSNENLNKIIKNINDNLNYINITVSEKSVNNFVLDCIKNNFNKCNKTLLKINESLQQDLINNNNINLLLLEDVAELNRQLNQLNKTIIYFFSDSAKEIIAIRQLKKNASLLKATIKTLGLSGDMLEETEESQQA